MEADQRSDADYPHPPHDMSFPKGWHRPRGKCRVCGKTFALKAPSGDWVNALYPRRHNSEGGGECDGVWVETEITKDERKIKTQTHPTT